MVPPFSEERAEGGTSDATPGAELEGVIRSETKVLSGKFRSMSARNDSKGAIARARYLRSNMPPTELRFWNFLKFHFPELRFRRQYPADKYVLDFYSPRHRLCIELDGELHNQNKEKDAERDRVLGELGICTLRIKVEDFRSNDVAVLSEIREFVSWIPAKFKKG